MKIAECAECGAELKLSPARCPLCGAHVAERAVAIRPLSDVESYQSRVRMLRDQLRKLREDAGAA